MMFTLVRNVPDSAQEEGTVCTADVTAIQDTLVSGGDPKNNVSKFMTGLRT